MSQQVEISYLTLSEALQDVFVRQRTGVLSGTTEGRKERFYFLGGQLYLAGTNPCRDRCERVLSEPPAEDSNELFDPHAYLAREMGELVDELVETLVSWQLGDLRFTDSMGEVPDNIIGPVPTATLVMDLYTRGFAGEDILRRLGGAAAKFRSIGDERARRRIPDLELAELALLERLEHPASVEKLLSEDPDTSSVLGRLARLHSVELVEAVLEPGKRASAISRDVLDRISERVREDLEQSPLDLDSKDHRERVGKMLSEYGRLGFYELLGVGGDDSVEAVHAAFMGAARLAHPVHAEALGLSGSRRKLEWLLARLTEAYLVLTDPVRSAEYRRSSGVVPRSRSAGPDSPERRSERAALARERYHAALDRIEEGDFFYAIEMLRHAVQTDERPEYYAMLGRCQMQNPEWLHMAVDSLRRAVVLSPEDEELKTELAGAREQLQLFRERAKHRDRDRELEGEETSRVQRALSKLRGQEK